MKFNACCSEERISLESVSAAHCFICVLVIVPEDAVGPGRGPLRALSALRLILVGGKPSVKWCEWASQQIALASPTCFSLTFESGEGQAVTVDLCSCVYALGIIVRHVQQRLRRRTRYFHVQHVSVKYIIYHNSEGIFLDGDAELFCGAFKMFSNTNYTLQYLISWLWVLYRTLSFSHYLIQVSVRSNFLHSEYGFEILINFSRAPMFWWTSLALFSRLLLAWIFCARLWRPLTRCSIAHLLSVALCAARAREIASAACAQVHVFYLVSRCHNVQSVWCLDRPTDMNN